MATLLKAHAADSATWRLVVAGTGPLLSELRTQFPDAEFKGHLAGADLTSIIRGAAVVVVPSEWHENSPSRSWRRWRTEKPFLHRGVVEFPSWSETD